MTRLLYIARHAWAGDADYDQYPNDELRPLTDKGRKRFAEQVSLLADRGFEPRHVATSPLTRCRQTADIISRRVSGRPEVEELAALAPGARLEPLLEWCARFPKGDLAWVGHAPDVGYLTSALIGDGREPLDFSKGAVAAIEFEDDILAGEGRLRWLVTAAVLGC